MGNRQPVPALATELRAERPDWPALFSLSSEFPVRTLLQLLQDETQLVVEKGNVTSENVAKLLGVLSLKDAIGLVCNVRIASSEGLNYWQDTLAEQLEEKIAKQLGNLSSEEQLQLIHDVTALPCGNEVSQESVLETLCRTAAWPSEKYVVIIEHWFEYDLAGVRKPKRTREFVAALVEVAQSRFVDSEQV